MRMKWLILVTIIALSGQGWAKAWYAFTHCDGVFKKRADEPQKGVSIYSDVFVLQDNQHLTQQKVEQAFRAHIDAYHPYVNLYWGRQYGYGKCKVTQYSKKLGLNHAKAELAKYIGIARDTNRRVVLSDFYYYLEQSD